MRGMNDPEIKPVPLLPWHRAIVTRSPRGRKLRRRVFVALVLLSFVVLGPWPLGWDLRNIAASFGWKPSPCQQHTDCRDRCGRGYVGQCFSGKCRCYSPEFRRASRRTDVLTPPGPGCELDIEGGLARALTEEWLDGDDPVAWFCRNINWRDGGDIP
jgi:hypothetical protein